MAAPIPRWWHFLTGQPDQIKALTDAVGFQYQFDPKTGQYAHATAIVLLTPDRHIAEYFYGVEFSPRDLRLGLVQAGQGKIGNITDTVLLYCYHYDPRAGKYGAVISNVLKIAASRPSSSWRMRVCDVPCRPQRGAQGIGAEYLICRNTYHCAGFGVDHVGAGGYALHLLLLVASVMTTLIFLAVTVLAIKYRRKPGVEAHQIEGSTILEITWSVIPFGVMLTFFIWGAVIFFQERTPPADSTEVYVVAKQWMWKIEHMEGQREINELHVPTARTSS